MKSAPLSTAEKIAKEHFQRGCELLQAKKYDEAVTEFQNALALDQDGKLGYARREEPGTAYLERGTLALRNSHFAAAMPDLERAAHLLPKEAKAFSRLGAAWTGQRRWDQAVKSLTTAIEIEHDAQDYDARGRAYRKLNLPEKAVADFHRAAELDPKIASAYAGLYDIYRDQNDLDRAIQEISKAVEICRRDPAVDFRELDALQRRAWAYLKLKRNDEAASIWSGSSNLPSRARTGATAMTCSMS